MRMDTTSLQSNLCAEVWFTEHPLPSEIQGTGLFNGYLLNRLMNFLHEEDPDVFKGNVPANPNDLIELAMVKFPETGEKSGATNCALLARIHTRCFMCAPDKEPEEFRMFEAPATLEDFRVYATAKATEYKHQAEMCTDHHLKNELSYLAMLWNEILQRIEEFKWSANENYRE